MDQGVFVFSLSPYHLEWKKKFCLTEKKPIAWEQSRTSDYVRNQLTVDVSKELVLGSKNFESVDGMIVWLEIFGESSAIHKQRNVFIVLNQ